MIPPPPSPSPLQGKGMSALRLDDAFATDAEFANVVGALAAGRELHQDAAEKRGVLEAPARLPAQQRDVGKPGQVVEDDLAVRAHGVETGGGPVGRGVDVPETPREEGCEIVEDARIGAIRALF